MKAILSRLHGRSPREIGQLIVKNVHYMVTGLSRNRRAERQADRAFDRRWGTDTSGTVSVHDLGIGRSRMARCHRYDPSSEAMLRDPVAALGINPADFSFVDYGAGKGRAMMLAMSMGFARVTGVELSTRLCAIARSNVDRFACQQPGMPAARVIGADASMFKPDGANIVAYFYNPFDATIMGDVRRRLEDALRHRTGRVVVIYANPEYGDVFGTAPGWKSGPAERGLATFIADARHFRAKALAA